MSDPNTIRGADRTPSGSDEISVLLVDDDETWAASTAQVLEHQSEAITVRTATDLTAASAAFEESAPDCVVCDYDLGSGTGLDFLAEVRERTSDRPFILITGQGSESVASEAIGREVTDYLPKRSLGGRDDLLLRRIESAVDSYRTERALARERRSKEAMLDILTATSSRDGLARKFCDHLVRERGYECAWIGTVDQSQGVVPQAVAGAEDYVDDAIVPGTTPQAGTEPALVAVARTEAYTLAAIEPEPNDGGWRRLAADHGFESAAAVPIDHEGSVFGVLAVYKTTPTLDPREETLLQEYSETIGYALRSAEWKESLLSATPVSIEVELGTDSVPLVALDRQLPEGSTLEVLTTIPREERLLYVVRIEGVPPEQVRNGSEGIQSIEDVTVTRETDPLRCEVVASAPTPETVLAERGGRVVEAVAERGRVSITTRAPSEETVQSLVDAVQSVYPDAGVRSVRNDDSTARGTTADELLDSLTEKQRKALELAFYNGYFERPREHNTTEVAEKLGVSRPTLTQHLRAGEKKVLSGLLDPSTD